MTQNPAGMIAAIPPNEKAPVDDRGFYSSAPIAGNAERE